jgi:hypothetical protein
MTITIKRGEYFKEIEVEDGTQVSDGYHTFDELYDHRLNLWIALCRIHAKVIREQWNPVFRAKIHSDGTNYEGWFMLGMFREPGHQITYHLPLSRWDECDFAVTLDHDHAPEFDGHTSKDVLERLKRL